MRGLLTVLKPFGVIAVSLFAAIYVAGYVFGIAGWDERGWIVAAACSGFVASVLVLMAALCGIWSGNDLKSLALLTAIGLGAMPIVGYVFGIAGWATDGWQFPVALSGVAILVWSALPLGLLERLRIVPKRPPLSTPSAPHDLRKLPQSVLLDRAIRRDRSER